MSMSMSMSAFSNSILALLLVFVFVQSYSLVDFQAELHHADSLLLNNNVSFTIKERIQRAVSRSSARHLRKVSFQAPLASEYLNYYEYSMDIQLGTPGNNFRVTVDTGSDLLWVQCKPCLKCYQQDGGLYSPSNSSSYKSVECSDSACSKSAGTTCASSSSQPCTYSYGYADGSSTNGTLVRDQIAIGSGSRSYDVAFGCGNNNSDGFGKTAGLIGLGQGSASVIKQLNIPVFSYCLVSYDQQPTTSSNIFFGNSARREGGQSAPIHGNDYIAHLNAITVGNVTLRNTRSKRKMLFDSGTSFTTLPTSIYKRLLAEITTISDNVSECIDAGLLGFESPPTDTPHITLHFENADMEIPPENYIIEVSSGTFCFAIQDAGTDSDSILGNFQQQNFYITYDLERKEISFIKETCS